LFKIEFENYSVQELTENLSAYYHTLNKLPRGMLGIFNKVKVSSREIEFSRLTNQKWLTAPSTLYLTGNI